MSRSLVGAIDQGTSSTRFLVFESNTAKVVASHQEQLNHICPEKGWVEIDPFEILETVKICLGETIQKLKDTGRDPSEIKAIGISNQRETSILWDKITGQPLYNAIVWLDTRTVATVDYFIEKAPGRNKDYLQYKCGLPLSTYFSSVKIHWLIRNQPEIRKAIDDKRCLFGTVDSWLLWNLTGGKDGGIHITDVTNASRTMLMNIESLKWDHELCHFFEIPMEILPEIRSSSEIYGSIKGMELLNGVPLSGCLGDQSAALVGQMCFSEGMAKNTYGTGCFLLYNTGLHEPKFSKHGLLTTIAYKFGKDKPPCYALEGSIAVAGLAIRWLKDNVRMISAANETEELASSVASTNGVYFVPAFSGLFAPHWASTAKGLITGLTQDTSRGHLVRAALEAVCFQTREILEAMEKDSGVKLNMLRVDGGMCDNKFFLQLQADTIGITVVRADIIEVSALGAAIAAGAAEGINLWTIDGNNSLIHTQNYEPDPKKSVEARNTLFEGWKDAVAVCIYAANLSHRIIQ